MRKRSSDAPCHRALIAVDIEASTARTNPDKIKLRTAMYRLFEAALLAAGISRRHRDPLIDRGDGILALIHPADHTPKTLLLNPVIPTLARLLVKHNAHHPRDRFRLRAVIHAGEVHYDRRGCFGEALDIAFRLLDAPEVKTTLRHTGTPLVLVVSDLIYRSVVRHGYDGIDNRTFAPLVRVEIASQEHCGWIQLSHEPNPAKLMVTTLISKNTTGTGWPPWRASSQVPQ